MSAFQLTCLPPIDTKIKDLAIKLLTEYCADDDLLFTVYGRVVADSGVNIAGTSSNKLFSDALGGLYFTNSGIAPFNDEMKLIKKYYQDLISLPINVLAQVCKTVNGKIMGPAGFGPTHRYNFGPSIIIPISDNVRVRTFKEKPNYTVEDSEIWKVPSATQIDCYNGMFPYSSVTVDTDEILEIGKAYLINWKDVIVEEVLDQLNPTYKIAIGIGIPNSISVEEFNSYIKI